MLLCSSAFMLLATLWQHYLYQPLLNAILFLYDGPARENMGWAVILLTVILRFILLPFTLLSRRPRSDEEKLEKAIAAIEQDFKNDPVAQKEEIRAELKKHRVSPLGKSVSILIQGLVLVILYQVFVGGFRFFNAGAVRASFYPWVPVPDYVNTRFFGADILERNVFWAGLVGFVFYLEIIFEQKGKEVLLQETDIVYRYMMPIMMFAILWLLPMAKSLFILTSIIFSFIIASITKLSAKS